MSVFYTFKGTKENYDLLSKNAEECYYSLHVPLKKDFTVCYDCIVYADDKGLGNAKVSSVESMSSEGMCCICGEGVL
jgi:hypothetical protein